ncbi:MAG TPA: biotin--[acetyl-CoA-carboxylase] ligase [Gemmatimonadales bacterium]|nr:biotin--[acetyl-CoA-carboxylase] ligase [Gemmatimonadales bacterium]
MPGVAYDGLPTSALSARLRTPGLVCLAAVGSALDELHRLAADDAPAGTAVLADRQTRGRGRQGRAWESPAGQGVWLAYLMRPQAMETGVLALRAGLAVARAVEALGPRPRIKWPNDVMLGDRKLAGVLCEARWSGGRPAWVALGIGINVTGPLPDELRRVGATLDEAVSAGRVDLLEHLMPLLHGLSGCAELEPCERQALAARDWLAGRRLSEPVAGTPRGLDAQGALLVETENGMQRLTGGTIRLME